MKKKAPIAPQPPEQAQDAAVIPAAAVSTTEEAVPHRAGQLAAIDYDLFHSHPLRMEVCKERVEYMLRSGQGVTAQFEPVTNFLGMVKHEEDGTPEMALVLYDQARDLKLTLNPHNDSRPLRLSQTKEIPVDAELPAGTPEIYAKINALSRSGQSMADIIASNSEAASTFDNLIRSTVKAAKAGDDGSLTDLVVSGGYSIAQVIGARLSKSASMVFGVAGAAQSLRDNHPAQAAINVVNGLPGVGFVLSEILQLIGNKMGLDVEPSLLQRLGDSIEVINSIGPTGEFNGLSTCGNKARPAPTSIAENDKISTSELTLARNSLISPDSEKSEPTTTPVPRPNPQPF